MAQTPESKVKATIRAVLEAHRVYYAMPMGTGYGNAGVPDFLCCHRGRFIAIEAKAGPGRTTALQKRTLQKIEEAGGIALVINETNVSDLIAALDAAADTDSPPPPPRCRIVIDPDGPTAGQARCTTCGKWRTKPCE